MSLQEFIQNIFKLFPPPSEGQDPRVLALQGLFNSLNGGICIVVAIALFYITRRINTIPGRSIWALVAIWLFVMGVLFASRALAYHYYNLANLDTVVRILLFPLGVVILISLPSTIILRLRSEIVLQRYLAKMEETKRAAEEAHRKASQLETLVKRQLKDE